MKLILLICTLIGCWQPPSWMSLPKRIMYSAYRLLLIAILCTFTVSQFVNVLLNIDKFDEISDCIYMTLTVLIATYKIIAVWINEKNITGIVKILAEKPFTRMGPSEEVIQRRYNKAIKRYALWYAILIETTLVTIILASAFTDRANRQLTYKAWLPYDYTPVAMFYSTYIHQLIGITITGNVNIACDSLMSGLLQQICCQIEILEYRLTKISRDEYVLGKCVRHHNRIYEYAQTVNVNFAKIIGFQFMVSTLVLCANLYKLATTTMLAELVALMLYATCILSQIFLYCWFGNELKLKSASLSNSIYNIDWQILDDSTKKSLLLIMRRSTVPIEFNSAVIITLNLDSFVSLLKTSYSVYNVLRHAQ